MRRLFLFLAMFAFVGLSESATAQITTIAQDTTGNLTWTLTSDGTLTISDSGAIAC